MKKKYHGVEEMKSPIGSGVWGQGSEGCSPILLSVQGVQVASLSPGDPEGQSVRELKHNKEFPHCLAPPLPQQDLLTYRGTLWSREPRRTLQTWEALKWKQKSLEHPFCFPPPPSESHLKTTSILGASCRPGMGSSILPAGSHFICPCSPLGGGLWLFSFGRERN